MTSYSVDDIARYSPWPSRLLGIEPWEARVKTPAEIDREYGREKWGRLLERAVELRGSGGGLSLDEVDRWASEGGKLSLVSVMDELVEMTPEESHAAYIDFAATSLEPYLPASAVVELGCGYGSVILGIGKRQKLATLPLFAADFTTSGPQLAGLIAGAEGVELVTGQCDFGSSPITGMGIPADALIFTAFSAACVDTLGAGFIDDLIAFRPEVVVHLEPVLEHCANDSLLGLLRRRYIEVNGYNRNLVTLLHEQEAQGKIRIVQESRPLFGPNPLLAASVIAWVPVEDRSRGD